MLWQTPNANIHIFYTYVHNCKELVALPRASRHKFCRKRGDSFKCYTRLLLPNNAELACIVIWSFLCHCYLGQCFCATTAIVAHTTHTKPRKAAHRCDQFFLYFLDEQTFAGPFAMCNLRIFMPLWYCVKNQISTLTNHVTMQLVYIMVTIRDNYWIHVSSLLLPLLQGTCGVKGKSDWLLPATWPKGAVRNIWKSKHFVGIKTTFPMSSCNICREGVTLTKVCVCFE